MLSITNPSASSVSQMTVNPDNISSELKKKKKKKRIRDDSLTDSEKPKEKKSRHIPQIATDATTTKKKKNKGKAREKPLANQTDAELEASTQETTAALLSAIAAASSTTPPQLPAQPPFDPSLAPHGQFMSYPPIHYPYPGPPPPFELAAQHPSVFSVPPLSGAQNAFSELAFGSNDDVIRALQDLDMTKIANVLKSLSDAATSTNPHGFAPQLSYLPSQHESNTPVLKQPPAPSNMILGLPLKVPQVAEPQPRRPIVPAEGSGSHEHLGGNPDHAHLLATKWLGASKLAELVRDEGLVYKKGKFSAIEEEQLRAAILRYQTEKGLTEEQLLETIYAKNDKNKDTAFWSELTSSVPLRPIIAVYHHVKRAYHPLKQQGTWKPEEDNMLKQAVMDLGQHWEKVSYRVGRMASDCRDRYRNHIVNRDIRVSGHWSKEEEEQLTRIVTDMTVKQGRDADNDVFWGKVSELMGGTRGRQQCRIKWTDALSKTMKNAGQKPRWSQQDGFILVHKIDSMNVRDDTEIDWKTLLDPDWNLWSAHTLQRRWLTMKKGVKGYEDMSHQEIMDILRIKRAHLPEPPAPSSRKRKERKVTSTETIHDSTDGRENTNDTISEGTSTMTAENFGQSQPADSDEADDE